MRSSPTDEDRAYYNESQHFRETIHGVLFVKMTGDPYCLIYQDYVNRGLEFKLIPNMNLLQQEEYDLISKTLNSFLKKWERAVL